MRNKPNTFLIIKLFFIHTFAFILTGSVLICNAGAGQTVSIGYFEKKPIIFLDESGHVRGLAADILMDIAKTQEWDLKFVKGSLAETLDRVMSGQVDLMVPIGYTRDRDERMDFSGIPFFETWGCLYTMRDGSVESLADLEGKRIGEVKQSLFNPIFRKMVTDLAINCQFVEVGGYADLINGLTAGDFDAAVGERLAVLFVNTEQARQINPLIVFNPFSLYVGGSEGDPKGLLDAVTRYIETGKSDPDSDFSNHKKNWLSHNVMGTVPVSLMLIFVFIPVLAAFLAYILSRIPAVRSALGMTDIVRHQVSTNILIITVVLAVSVWGVGILVQYYGVGGAITLKDAVLPLQHPEKIFLRFFIIAIVLLGGILISKTFSRLAIQHEITKKHEQRLNLALYAANDSVWDWHLDENTFFFDDRYFSMLGYEPGAFESSLVEWENRLHPDDRARAKNMLEKYICGDADEYDQEFRLLTKTSDYLWVRSKGKIAERDKNGKPIRFIGTHSDINKRKLAEEAARENQDWIQNILDSIQAGVLVIDSKTHKILELNQAALDMIGASKKQVLGKLCHQYICPNEMGNCPVTDLGQHIEQSERMLIQADGTQIPILKTVNKAIINGREYLIESFLDLRDKKQLESLLLQAQKMEAIGTLAGGIAHDFNNILSGMFGYTQLVEMNLENKDKARTYLGQIHKGAQRASSLVQQILTFSRQTEQQMMPVTVSVLLKEALQLIRSSIPTTIEIKKHIKTDHQILADPTQIHQVIVNLCTNAYQAMSDQGGILTIVLEDVALSDHKTASVHHVSVGNYIKLEVKDTGHGIEEQILNRIFEPYFTTKEMGKGTGLGLSTVTGIVKKHNGFITVESRISKGSTFQVYLPVISSEDMEHQSNGKDNIDRTGNEHIMLVDDEVNILYTLRDIMTVHGYKVSTFENGDSALKSFADDPDKFDIVITDMTMPQMTGDKLSREILKIRPKIPIIICTGYHEQFTESEAKAAGIRMYLEKPVSGIKLSEVIRKIIDENASENPAS